MRATSRTAALRAAAGLETRAPSERFLEARSSTPPAERGPPCPPGRRSRPKRATSQTAALRAAAGLGDPRSVRTFLEARYLHSSGGARASSPPGRRSRPKRATSRTAALRAAAGLETRAPSERSPKRATPLLRRSAGLQPAGATQSPMRATSRPPPCGRRRARRPALRQNLRRAGPAPVAGADVAGRRADQPVALHLLEDVRRPAAGARQGERRREQLHRQPDAVQQQRRVELDVGVEPPLRLAARAGRAGSPPRRCARRRSACRRRRARPAPPRRRRARRRADRAPGRRDARSPSCDRRRATSRRTCAAASSSSEPPRRAARSRSANTMSSAGPGAPPCSGPFNAPMRADERRADVRLRAGDDPRGEGRRVHAVIDHRVAVGLQRPHHRRRPARARRAARDSARRGRDRRRSGGTPRPSRCRQ